MNTECHVHSSYISLHAELYDAMQHKFPRTDCGKSEPSPESSAKGPQTSFTRSWALQCFRQYSWAMLKWGEIGFWQGNAGHTIAYSHHMLGSWAFILEFSLVQLHFLSNDASVRLFPAVVPIRSPDSLDLRSILDILQTTYVLPGFDSTSFCGKQIMTNKRVLDGNNGIYVSEIGM